MTRLLGVAIGHFERSFRDTPRPSEQRARRGRPRGVDDDFEPRQSGSQVPQRASAKVAAHAAGEVCIGEAMARDVQCVGGTRQGKV